MKNIVILFVSLVCMSMGSLENKTVQLTNAYVGTWQYQNGNQRFIVKIWEEEKGKFMGHYKMITVNSNGVQTGVVYNSRKDYGNGNYSPQFVMYGTMLSQHGLSGKIMDNTIAGYNDSKKGDWVMKIQNTGTSPYTATWKVTEVQGLKAYNEPIGYSIPIDIILTKVSNTVNLD